MGCSFPTNCETSPIRSRNAREPAARYEIKAVKARTVARLLKESSVANQKLISDLVELLGSRR